MLSQEELARYDRQIMIPEIGREGQERLKKAKVFVAGAGGLGCPISIYLAVAGVGQIRIADNDRVDLSNLNRQILHWGKDIGRLKADSAGEKLFEINPHVKIETVSETIDEGNVFSLTDGFDVILDAMDNWAARYVLNRAALEKNIPFFHGAVRGLEGRAMTVIPGKTACLRCMYHGTPPPERSPVLGATPSVIAAIQVTEAVKYIVGVGDLLAGRLLIYDGMNMTFREFKLKKNPECDHCGRKRLRHDR
ncbi:MAG: HesA/MoeB/ThiF family protein [Deltaproteobacteria bacterium]|nr:HesA/MoeB/ThiF family protein [Deltaproteobacteria bacterium]